jgi:putative phosphoribosyl transferase
MQGYKSILQSREDAAKRLVDIMPMQQFKEEEWYVVAVSTGGLELAKHIKGRHTNPLDILFLEPIFAPNNAECEVARVSESEEIVLNEKLIDSFEIQYDYIYGQAHRKHEEDILANIYQYRKGRAFPSMKDRVVLLVDEGSETGTKFMTALKTVLNQKPKAVYIAVPVLPADVLEVLETFVDEIFFLYEIDDYVETAQYYKELPTLSDIEIEQILEENR